MTHPNKETAHIACRLLSYLRDELDDPTIEYDLPLTRLLGGFETSIYQFKLSGIQRELNERLVLRLYPERYGPENAVWESRVQNALAKEGFPVARVYLVCTDSSILGGAFFVMDLLPGELLIAAPVERIPEILGKAQATLHKSDPQALIASLNEQGIDADRCRLNNRSGLGQHAADELLWIRDGIGWLIENRPPEPARLAICHGDFHALNILVQDAAVTGILDWADFLIADPAWDVANTILRITMPFKYLVSSLLGPDFALVDWDESAQVYLDAYRAQNPLGTTNLDYYRARQSIHALIEGVQGHPVWRHPPIVQDLIELVHRVTGIRIAMPG